MGRAWGRSCPVLRACPAHAYGAAVPVELELYGRAILGGFPCLGSLQMPGRPKWVPRLAIKLAGH